MRFLPAFRSDIPFSRDDANRFLPWIVALMVCLTALMICVGLSLGQMLGARHANFSQTITVQIPSEAASEDTVSKALKTLEDASGINNAARLSEAEVREMVAPWIGDDKLAQALPLPAVLHAKLGSAKVDTKTVTQSLNKIDGRITVDTHELWAVKFAQLSRAIQGGLYTLSLFILATLAAMVVFTAREAMKLHKRTVLLLHAIGADDRYIAKQFQNNALTLAFRGAVMGSVFGTAIFALAGWYIRLLDAPLLPNFALSNTHSVALVGLPLLCSLLALFSARFTVLSQLKSLP